MIPLNVSFGIHALLPTGWLFMGLVIYGEGYLMRRYLTQSKVFDFDIHMTAFVSNGISGIIGIIISTILNGGWWLVCWFPWVSSNEVNIHKPTHLQYLALYYVVALILSILIELRVNYLFLRKRFPFKRIWKATLIANACSYAVGTLLISLFILL